MRSHHTRVWATDHRDRETGNRVTVYCFSCTPCEIHNKTFKTKASRDRAVKEHEQS